MSWPRIEDQKILAGLLASLVLVAWCALWLWGSSPYGHLLLHGGNMEHMAHMGAARRPLFFAALFVLGWTLMTVAMMLPTSSPLILLFHRLVHDRRYAGRLVALLIAGYLTVWIFFGVLVHFLNWTVRSAVHAVPLLAGHPRLLGSAILLVAGLYQFSPLKYSCLDKCRSPMAFIVERWRGGSEAAQSLRLGIDHGIFCVGCCWSLMLLMFVVGTGSLGWMLLLGLVMAAEKNLPWGRHLSAPLGASLIVIGAVVVLT